MKEIYLSQGKIALVDDDDFERLCHHKWAACIDGATFYAYRQVKRGEEYKTYRIAMHREIMNNPKGMVIDHINGDGLDNRKSNLRVCTVGENRRNSSAIKGSASRYKGVSWNSRKKKWKADITVNYTPIFLGYFTEENKAAEVYNVAARLCHGEYAKINVLDGV